MSYGIEVKNAAGVVTFDSTQVVGGCLIDVVRSLSSSAVVRSYPAFSGRSARVIDLDYWGLDTATVDYALGYPRITLPAMPTPRTFSVFAL